MSKNEVGTGSVTPGDPGPSAGQGTQTPLPSTVTNVDPSGLAPGTLLAGRYRIGGLLGAGGMGLVYKAHDEELNLDIALKVLRSDLGSDPRLIERFRREIILARQVSHPNVVRIHDIGESGGLRFLTMDYVAGRSLLQVLDREGPLPLARTVRIVSQIADALQQAHDKGVIHRDLKPGNILLGADDTAYISDFGVARSLDRDGITRAGAVVGTPDYLSPEQVCGDEVDARSDIYALGIVFYEMLTGQLPFKGESQAEMLAQRLTGRVRSLSDSGAVAPAYVRRAIRRCLERNPARRYQRARELVGELSGSRSPGSLRRPWAAVAAGLLIGVMAWAAPRATVRPQLARWLGRSAPAPAIAPAHAVAVLPLADETGDPSLAWGGTGLAELIGSSLANSPDLRVVDAARVFRTLGDLRVARERYDERTLRQLSDLFDIDRVIAGSLRRAGSTVRVDLRLVEVGASGTLRVRYLSAETTGEAGLFRLAEDLAGRLRAELGGARPSIPEGPAGQTTSTAAARAYVEGRGYLLRGDAARAASALEKAVESDPTFAAALERLSEAYQHLGYQEKALAAAERAAKAIGGAESRLGYRVRARLTMLGGDPAEAEKTYAELARRYPNDIEPLLDLAAAQSAGGDVAKAVETLKKAAALDQTDPRAWFLLGRNSILMGDSAKAVNDYLVRALALQGQLHNEPGQAEALNAMGAAYHQLGDYAQAIEKYSAALTIRQRLGDERGTATSLKNRARTYLAMTRYDGAASDLRAARDSYQRIGDRAGLADIMNDFGVLYEGRGAYDEALAAYQGALKIRRDLGDDRLLAQSYDNVGYIFHLQGEYDNALVYWKEALDLRRKIGDKSGVILSTQNMGFLQTAQGRWSEAVKSFLDALEGSREIDFRNAMAVSFGNLGVLYQYEGRYDAALTSFDEALAILRPLEDKRGLAEFTIKRAAALMELGRFEEAKASLDRAEPWVIETANREQLSDYRVLLGEWQGREGDREGSRRSFRQAVQDAVASKSPPAILRARLAESAAAVEFDKASAMGDLGALQRDADSLGDAMLRLRAAEALARAQLARSRTREAGETVRRAIGLAERYGWEAGLYRLHALAGRILDASGDKAGAATHYRESEARIAKLRERLPQPMRISFDALPAVRETRAWLSGH